MESVFFNLIVVIISSIITLFLMPANSESFSTDSNFVLTILAVFNVVFFWSTTKRLFDSWIRYETLFLLGFLIVHFQIPFLESISISPDDPVYTFINIRVVNYATWLSTIAMLLWIFGFLMFLKKKNKEVLIVKKYLIDTKKIDILLIIVFTLFVVLVGNDFLKGVYNGGNNWGEGATYAFLLLSVTLYLRIIYFFQNNRDARVSIVDFFSLFRKNKIVSLVSILYVLIFLLAGDRGPVMEIAIVFFGAYSIYQKRIPLYVFLGGIFFSSVVFTLISFGRTDDLSSKSGNVFQSGLKSVSEREQSFNPTNELAMSNRILFRAIDAVPNQYPFVYGYLMFGDIVGIIPFAGAIRNQISEVPIMYKSSAYFFSYLGQGQFITYGEGTEIIADIYINFGFYGVLILMALFGYYMAYLSSSTFLAHDHRNTVIYLLFLIGAIYINRSNLLGPLKLIFYGVLLDKFIVKKVLKA